MLTDPDAFSVDDAARLLDDADESVWLPWLTETEELVGCDLDGDLERDGHSVAYAYQLYLGGLTPAQAASAIGTNMLLVARRQASRQEN